MPNFQRGAPAERSRYRRPDPDRITSFRAVYGGTCFECDEDFDEGDDVGYIGQNAGGVSCNQCILDEEERRSSS